MRISMRLLTNSVLIASFAVIVTSLLIGGVSYSYGKSILEQQAEERLILVRESKADNIKRYFEALKNQAITFSHNLTVIAAMEQLNAAFMIYSNEIAKNAADAAKKAADAAKNTADATKNTADAAKNTADAAKNTADATKNTADAKNASEAAKNVQEKYDNAVIQRYINAFSNDYAKNNGGLQFDATPYLNVRNESTFALQYNYIFNNPYGIDRESKLDTVNDGTTYSKIHKLFHDQLRQFKELYDFEDIFLVDPVTGDIIYSVAKGLDFTTSLESGPYAQTAIGQVFRKANDLDKPNQAIISDFQPYSPSNDDQAAFVAAPIFDGDKKVGILIFQLNIKVLNDIMTSSKDWKDVGLGETGETYLIDPDHRMLTTSRFYLQDPRTFLDNMQKLGMDPDVATRIKAKNDNLGWQKIDTLAATKALGGESGFDIYTNYLGKEVLGTFAPIDVSGMRWAIICELDAAEAFAPVKELAHKILVDLGIIMALILIFSVIVGIGLARQISLPIEKLSAMIQILANTQDLTQRIEYKVNDEIGDMAKSLNHLIESFQHTCQETIASTQRVHLAAHKLMALADDIDAREATHKYEDNFENIHEKTEAIKEAGDSLEELSDRLQILSRQFKVFEAENERTSNW